MHAQFERYRAMVEAALPLALPKDGGWAEVITDAARYSLLAGGKRLRPCLVLAAAERVGKCVEDLFRRRSITVWMVACRSRLQFTDPGIAPLRPAPHFINAVEIGRRKVFRYIMTEEVMRRMYRDTDAFHFPCQRPLVQPAEQTVTDRCRRVRMSLVDRVDALYRIA